MNNTLYKIGNFEAVYDLRYSEARRYWDSGTIPYVQLVTNYLEGKENCVLLGFSS